MDTPKKSSFFSMAPVTSTLICTSSAATRDVPAPLVKGAFSSEEDQDKSKSQKPAAVSAVVDEFFWIGSSIVAFSKWRLGYTGRFQAGSSGFMVEKVERCRFTAEETCDTLLS